MDSALDAIMTESHDLVQTVLGLNSDNLNFRFNILNRLYLSRIKRKSFPHHENKIIISPALPTWEAAL